MTCQKNPFTGVKVEFHILQSFPVSCLNRDDVNAPKTALVGGVSRARVSSQCWKRQVRMMFHELGVTTGVRTKLVSSLVAEACLEKGATPEQAKDCGDAVAKIFIKGADKKGKAKKGKGSQDGEQDAPASDDASADKSDTLLFLTRTEAAKLAEAFKADAFTTSKATEKEVSEIVKNAHLALSDGLDIALFGRMVAQAAILNVEASASFAHAISTHKASNEIEFFTAIDDFNKAQGSAHMGSLEFNSATYYRYVSLDLGQLFANLNGDSIPEAVAAFVKALYMAVPAARQATMSGAAPWDFASLLLRKGQRLQVSFDEPVKSSGSGFLKPSVERLKASLKRQESLSGSLYGLLDKREFGEDESFSVDKLVAWLSGEIKKLQGA